MTEIWPDDLTNETCFSMRAGVQLVKWLMNRWKQGRKSRNYFQWQDTKGKRRWCCHGHISWLFQFEASLTVSSVCVFLGSGFILLLKRRQTGISHVGRYIWVCSVCGGSTISATLLIAVTERHHSLAKQFFSHKFEVSVPDWGCVHKYCSAKVMNMNVNL